MQSLIDLATSLPGYVWGCVWLVGYIAAAQLLRRWTPLRCLAAIFWPIVTPLYLITLPARWLWRRWKRRRERRWAVIHFKQWCGVDLLTPDTKLPNHVSATSAQIQAEMELIKINHFRRIMGAEELPADSKPDLPPYGSKVSEDGKPVTRAEFERLRRRVEDGRYPL